MCSNLRFSDKTGILNWCTAARVTLFCFAQAATVPFCATETLGVEEPLRLINLKVRLIVKSVNRCIPIGNFTDFFQDISSDNET